MGEKSAFDDVRRAMIIIMTEMMMSSMNINEILKIARAHLLQRPLHYFSASYASALCLPLSFTWPVIVLVCVQLICGNDKNISVLKSNLCISWTCDIVST